MSKHKKILPLLIKKISQEYVNSGILLGGSVQGGYERPDSDIDVLVVLAGDGEIRTDQSHKIGDIKTHIVYLPVKAMQEAQNKQPILFYLLSICRIIHDPRGIARRYQEMARKYFRDNPDIAQAWDEQTEKIKRHKLDRNYKLEFPKWDDFAEQIKQIILKR